MPSQHSKGPGRRVNVWIPERHLALWDELENKSQFVQIALDDATGLMAFAIIKEAKGIVRPKPTQEQIGEFNEKFPLDPLTAKRLGKEKQWPKNSPKKPELW